MMMNKQKEIERINSCISDLVYEKTQLRKAYNYYHCIRDKEQFRHIEENYGIGTPTSIGFTPLIKKHIDVLVGEYLELDPDLTVTCKDDRTVSDIMRDKQLKIHSETFKFFKNKLQNAILQIFQEGKDVLNDPYFESEIERIKKDVSKSYISEYEKAAQNILNYIKYSRDIDLKNKMRELLTDLLIGGMAYYKTSPSESKTNLAFEVLNPLDTFVERNPNEFYLNKSPRAVVRKWMTKDQIFAKYYDELTPEARKILEDKCGTGRYCTNDVYIQTYSTEATPAYVENNGLLGGLEAHPVFSNDLYRNSQNLICVFECEWIVFENGKLTRHEGVKIDNDIYIVRGESKYITRSASNPKDCSLSINGLFFSDKNGDPFSIVLNTMTLQDKYDLTIYYRDSLVASSGTVGDWLDAASLPAFLGNELQERAQKWIAYKKQGIAWYDSSQDGANIINTAFNGYDDTVKYQAIQAFQAILDNIEQQASSITGVFPEKLGGIQQRDAVSNVKVGIRQSTLLTKQYFSAMDSIYKEANYDLLNLAKIVFKNGITGTIINGTKLNQIFTCLPQYYTMTDFDIHIQDSSDTYQDKETLKASCIELIKSGQADPTMIFNIMTAKNKNDLRDYITEAVDNKKKENDIISQLQQQLQQLQQQAQELQKQNNQLQEENQKLNKEIEKNSQDKLAIEQKRVNIEEKKANDIKENNDKLAEIKEKQLQIEALQTIDSNPYNDKIKNV